MSTMLIIWASLVVGCFFGMLIMSLMVMSGRHGNDE